MTTSQSPTLGKPTDEMVQEAVYEIESLLWSYDWIGTGTSQSVADADCRESWDYWTTIRLALGLGEPDERPT